MVGQPIAGLQAHHAGLAGAGATAWAQLRRMPRRDQRTGRRVVLALLVPAGRAAPSPDPAWPPAAATAGWPHCGRHVRQRGCLQPAPGCAAGLRLLVRPAALPAWNSAGRASSQLSVSSNSSLSAGWCSDVVGNWVMPAILPAGRHALREGNADRHSSVLPPHHGAGSAGRADSAGVRTVR